MTACANPSQNDPMQGRNRDFGDPEANAIMCATLDAAARDSGLDPKFKAEYGAWMDDHDYTQEEKDLTFRSLETFSKEIAEHFKNDEQYKDRTLRERDCN